MAEGAGAKLDDRYKTQDKRQNRGACRAVRLWFSIRTLSVINPQSIPLIHNFFF